MGQESHCLSLFRHAGAELKLEVVNVKLYPREILEKPLPPLLECVYFNKYLISTKAGSGSSLPDLSDSQDLIVKNSIA